MGLNIGVLVVCHIANSVPLVITNPWNPQSGFPAINVVNRSITSEYNENHGEDKNNNPDEEDNYFCNKEWFKWKCLHQCTDDPELCTPWVHDQCKECNIGDRKEKNKDIQFQGNPIRTDSTIMTRIESSIPGGAINANHTLSGCDCVDFINSNGFGQCKKHDYAFEGAVSCYVVLPSKCSDLLESSTNPGVYRSAQACTFSHPLSTSSTNTTTLITRVKTSPGCICSNFVNANGYGQCKKGVSSHQGARICYVELPSNCKDLVESQTSPGIFWSTEPCKLKISLSSTSTGTEAEKESNSVSNWVISRTTTKTPTFLISRPNEELVSSPLTTIITRHEAEDLSNDKFPNTIVDHNIDTIDENHVEKERLWCCSCVQLGNECPHQEINDYTSFNSTDKNIQFNIWEQENICPGSTSVPCFCFNSHVANQQKGGNSSLQKGPGLQVYFDYDKESGRFQLQHLFLTKPSFNYEMLFCSRQKEDGKLEPVQVEVVENVENNSVTQDDIGNVSPGEEISITRPLEDQITSTTSPASFNITSTPSRVSLNITSTPSTGSSGSESSNSMMKTIFKHKFKLLKNTFKSIYSYF